MNIVATLLGAALILLTLRDVLHEIFHPSGTGSASGALARATWRLSRRLAGRFPGVLPLAGPVAALHLLSGVSGWGFPARNAGSTSLTVRFTYADGQTEDHPLKNGVHFADYIRRVDVPESKFAFALAGGQQLRFLTVRPSRNEPLASVTLLKGSDDTAPIVMAATAEMRE